MYDNPIGISRANLSKMRCKIQLRSHAGRAIALLAQLVPDGGGERSVQLISALNQDR
jgi:hypothetical protein